MHKQITSHVLLGSVGRVFSDPHPELQQICHYTDSFACCKEAVRHIYSCTEIYIRTPHTRHTQFSCNLVFEVVGVEYFTAWPDLLGHDPSSHTHMHTFWVVTLETGESRARKEPMTDPQHHIIMTHKQHFLVSVFYVGAGTKPDHPAFI